MQQRPGRHIYGELASAYAASAARLGSWAAVTAVTSYRAGVEAFAVLALVRATLGILNYTTLGLAPAMIRLLPQAARADRSPTDAPCGLASDASQLFVNALTLVLAGGLLGTGLLALYAEHLDVVHRLPPGSASLGVTTLVWGMGIGVLSRLASEASSAALQVGNHIALDNMLAASAEVAWVVLVLLSGLGSEGLLPRVGWCFAVSGVLLLGARTTLASRLMFLRRRTAEGAGQLSGERPIGLSVRLMSSLVTYGGLITLAQLADYLYTPTDYLLINRWIDPVTVGVYAPAVQLDAALHLIVLGIASVLLPKASLAFASGDRSRVRRFYLRGTAAGLLLTFPAAVVLWLLSPLLFRVWLGHDMPLTRQILPLVLLHNLIGGSGTVGRSILLACGRAGAYTVSVLAAGLANVAISFLLVRYAGLGLTGIVLGTLLAVSGRCLLWQPWFIVRVLRDAAIPSTSPVDASQQDGLAIVGRTELSEAGS